jgi:hypothetical protein
MPIVLPTPARGESCCSRPRVATLACWVSPAPKPKRVYHFPGSFPKWSEYQSTRNYSRFLRKPLRQRGKQLRRALALAAIVRTHPHERDASGLTPTQERGSGFSGAEVRQQRAPARYPLSRDLPSAPEKPLSQGEAIRSVCSEGRGRTGMLGLRRIPFLPARAPALRGAAVGLRTRPMQLLGGPSTQGVPVACACPLRGSKHPPGTSTPEKPPSIAPRPALVSFARPWLRREPERADLHPSRRPAHPL